MSNDAQSKITTNDDGKHVRTALVIDSEQQGGSVDIVNRDGELLVRLNMFTSLDNDWFAVDVIDIENKFSKHTALHFEDGMRHHMDCGGKLIAADFRR